MFSSFRITSDPRRSMTTIKYLAIVFPLCLLLIGCEQPDAKLYKQVVGTWTHEGSFLMTFDSDGTFNSKLGNSNRNLNYFGTWLVKEDFLIQTLTNKSALNWINSEKVGNVDRSKIISVNGNQLTLEFNANKISYERRR
jgi:hypothetical protein